VAAHAFEIQWYIQQHSPDQKILFFMSSIKMFSFILNTRLTISGRSHGMSPAGRAERISGHAAFEVKAINRSGQPNFLHIPMQSWYFWYRYRGLPVNDAGKIILCPTDEPELIPFEMQLDMELYVANLYF
jgi:hypothetical protein